MQYSSIHVLDKYLTENNINAVVAAPKCTRENTWETISTYVYSLIETLSVRHNIDKTKVYLMGASFGGQGCWYFLSDARIFSQRLRSLLPRLNDMSSKT